MKLLKPSSEYLSFYVDALQRGWSPDNLRPQAREEQLDRISRDASAFLEALDDPFGKAGLVTLPDGSQVERLPSLRRWIWDGGAFCGQIGLRWQVGSEELPPTCSGHIGYAVVPWRQGEGLATAALLGILPQASAVGLRYVDITTNPENVASTRVIEKAGGTYLGTHVTAKSLGGLEVLKFRVWLSKQPREP